MNKNILFIFFIIIFNHKNGIPLASLSRSNSYSNSKNQSEIQEIKNLVEKIKTSVVQTNSKIDELIKQAKKIDHSVQNYVSKRSQSAPQTYNTRSTSSIRPTTPISRTTSLKKLGSMSSIRK